MKRILPVLAATLILATPAAAVDHKVKVFAAVGYVAPFNDEDITVGAVTDTIEASSELGYDFGIEWRATPLLGVELDYLNATHDVDFAGGTIGEVDLQPLSLSLNFHLLRTNLLDLYVGPTVSYVSWGDIDLNADGQAALGVPEVTTDSETAFGATVGVDIGIGERLAVVGSVRYLQVDVTPEGGDGLAVDPLITRVGLALRF